MFEDKPTDQQLRQLTWVFFVALLIIYPIMAYYFYLAESPSDVFVMGQLSFSGEVLKDYYFRTKNLDAYRTGQILDYIFMVVYGGLLCVFSLKAGRKFDAGSSYRKIGQNLAAGALIAAICDAFENGFILLTLDNPFGFPDWYAVMHSVLALIKWILIFICFIWIIFGNIASKRK
jgi:hypothetical protein